MKITALLVLSLTSAGKAGVGAEHILKALTAVC